MISSLLHHLRHGIQRTICIHIAGSCMYAFVCMYLYESLFMSETRPVVRWWLFQK